MANKKPSDCKFWEDGMCTHKDAPPRDKRCIGMGDDITGGCVAWRDEINMQDPRKGITGKTMHSRIEELNKWLAENRPGYEVRTNEAGKLEFELYGQDGIRHYSRDTFESIEILAKR